MKCRLCVFEFPDEGVTSIFSDVDELNLIKLIVKYLYLEITQYDEFSTKICFDCKRHLQEFHEFFEKVEQRQQHLSTCAVEQPRDDVFNITETEVTNFEHIEESSMDLKCEELESAALPEAEEFAFADNKIDVSTTLSNIEPILEPLKLIDKEIDKHASATAVKQKRGRPPKNSATDAKKVAAKKIKTTIEKKLDKNKMTAKQSVFSTEEQKERDDFIAKNIELKCEICKEMLPTFKGFRAHFIREHKQKAFITCCNLRFTHRFRLVNHIRLHIDPNYFKCKYCDKMLTTQFGLERHVINYHGDEEKNYECNSCNKRFSFKFSLQVHMASHEKEAKYQCEICNKSFKTSNSFRTHTTTLHGERKSSVCHVCGKEFKTKQSLQNHIKYRHTATPLKSKCSVCNKWISNRYMKRHEEYHVLEDAECDECGKVFPTKGALLSHKKGYAHKERIWNCTFCEKTFKMKQFLDEHIAIHTGRKDYFCKYCLRDFRSKSNMRKHVRQQHAEEYADEIAKRNPDISC